MIERLKLVYFTGTGNTYRVATWMEAAARKRGIAAENRPVDAEPDPHPASGPQDMLGLLSPTHAFTAPWRMLRFALGLPRGNGAQAFVVFTRAGTKFGKVFFPGLEGSGAYLLALILALKGYRVRGAVGLDMPSNWTTLHPGFKRDDAEAIAARTQPRALDFIERILDGQTAWRGQVELLFGIALIPISLGYLLIGRFLLAKLFFASDRCNGCALCEQSCPVGAIRMFGKNEPRPYWTFQCESCTRCMNFCPRQAVEASYPLAVFAVYLSNLPLAALLLDGLARWITSTANLKGTALEFILQYPFKLLAFALAYVFFSMLLRVPYASRLLALATPTHYYRRYHDASTRLADIRPKRGRKSL